MPEPDEERVDEQPVTRSGRSLAVRTAIGVLAVAGMLYGWAAMGRQKSLREHEAIRAVIAAGGTVYYDYQWEQGEIKEDGQPQQARWLRWLLGPEILDPAVAVELNHGAEHAELIRWLRLMPSLRWLSCGGPLSEADVASIGRMASLESLLLPGTGVTDTGVQELCHLSKLQHLSLASTAVTDQGLESLLGLRNLRRFDLSDTQVSPDAITHFQQKLPKCFIVATTSSPRSIAD